MYQLSNAWDKATDDVATLLLQSPLALQLPTRSTWLTHDLHPRLNRQSWTTSDAKLNIDSVFVANIIVYSSMIISFLRNPKILYFMLD